ncbi:hypothetical protein LTR84_010958 [Exophiala bonariae]|uniref:Mitochondrial thiamine pyrophosphate carrier 1 n=1 Tax=Exophiala bonariae TaxID=1690606 RepID=A0AAV9NM71_9EURO|nr:hypothetical protein LTR84_010958 [Exophiala bonariae]
MTTRWAEPSAFQSVLAGGVAGGAESLITYPTEFVKTKQQLAAKQGAHISPSRLLIDVVRREGFRPLYTGAGAFCLSNTSKSAVRFASFNFVRKHLPKDFSTGKISALGNMFAGLCAGIAESVTVLTPGENLKTKMIDNQAAGAASSYNSSWKTFRRIVDTEGVFALYRGVVPVSLKQSANAVVRFTTYQFLLEHIMDYSERQKTTLPLLAPAIAGGFAGIITVYCTMPFDVVKTKMQAIRGKSSYRGSFDCLQKIVAAHGIGILWKGTTPRLVRLSISGVLSFSIYEQVIALTSRSKADKDEMLGMQGGKILSS